MLGAHTSRLHLACLPCVAAHAQVERIAVTEPHVLKDIAPLRLVLGGVATVAAKVGGGLWQTMKCTWKGLQTCSSERETLAMACGLIGGGHSGAACRTSDAPHPTQLTHTHTCLALPSPDLPLRAPP